LVLKYGLTSIQMRMVDYPPSSFWLFHIKGGGIDA